MIGKVNRKARSRQGGGTAFIACAIAAILFAATPAHSATEDVTYTPYVSFTLLTGIAEGKLVYIGRGGEIDGIVNPTLRVREDAVVQITLINGEGAEHDIAFPDFKAVTEKSHSRIIKSIIPRRPSSNPSSGENMRVTPYLWSSLISAGTITPPPPPKTLIWPAPRSRSRSTIYLKYSMWPP